MTAPALPQPVAPSPLLAELNALGVVRLSGDGSAVMRPDGTMLAQLAVGPVTFSPDAGTYGPSQSVSLASNTSGASIYYTTDGSAPTTGSTAYTVPIVVTANTTIKALAVKSGMADSIITASSYVITNGTVATPTFSPVAGAVANPTPVTIASATAGASIYYTIDDSTPTTASTPYTVPVVVTVAVTIKALAVKTDYADSAVGTAAYTITP